MSAKLDSASETATHHRRQPIWPWLLMPLAALLIFFALRNARQSPEHSLPSAPPPAESTAAQ